MSISYGLTSETRIKNKLGITNSDFDTVIKRLIYGVTDRIEKLTERRFERATYTQELYDGSFFDGARKKHLVVKNAPITAISSFQYDAGDNITPSWTDFIASDYDTRNEEGLIRVYSSVPSGINNIRISYTAGYLIDFDNEFDDTLHTLPYDITEVCENAVIHLFKKRESHGREAETFDVSSINWQSSLFSKDDMEIINRYKRFFI